MGKAIYENYLKEKRIQLAFLVLVIGLGVAISGLSPYVFGEVIDIFSGEKQGNFKTWILFYALLLLLSQLFSVLESLTGQWIVTSIENRMKSRLMGRVLQFKSRSADGYEKGELLNRLEFDIETVGDYYIDLVSSHFDDRGESGNLRIFCFSNFDGTFYNLCFVFSTDVSGEFRVSGTGAAAGSTAKTDWRPVL